MEKTPDTLKRDLPPFTWLANNVLDDPRLTHLGLSVYMALCRFAGYKSRTAFPSIPRIAVVARLSSSSVKRGLVNLRKLGYLKTEAVFTEQGRGSNLYTICDKAKQPTKPLPVKDRYGSHRPLPQSTQTPTLGSHRPSNETYPNERYIKKAFNNKDDTPSRAAGPAPGPEKADASGPVPPVEEEKSNKGKSKVFKDIERVKQMLEAEPDVHERCKIRAHFRGLDYDV